LISILLASPWSLFCLSSSSVVVAIVNSLRAGIILSIRCVGVMNFLSLPS
jgi:hypothetical protein